MPETLRISVVVPVYCEPDWVQRCIAALKIAFEVAESTHYEIIVVDDGSGPCMNSSLAAVAKIGNVRVIRFPANQGRVRARAAGLQAAVYDMALLIDSRVLIHDTALQFLFATTLQHPTRKVWNAYCDMNLTGDPYSRVWYMITAVAWRRYLRNPHLASFDSSDFDHYPKGTTCFAAPTALLLRVTNETFAESQGLHMANDDTVIIRKISQEERIWLSPDFNATYNGSPSLRRFIFHTLHRGTVLIDGHLVLRTRFFYPIIATLALSVVVAVLTIVVPKFALISLALVVFVCGIAGWSIRRDCRDGATAALFVLPFSALYIAGMWRGIIFKLGRRTAAVILHR